MSTQERPAQPRATFADPAEIDAFVETLHRFEQGGLDADAWRAYRVTRGVYSQRQDGVHMLRIKLPQGWVDVRQLRALAEVARRFSRGFGHITTRQNFQVHFVKPGDLEAALRTLADAGITTLGSGGNAVRNVVACPHSGVSADEVFDVTPYAEALSRHFLRHPLASSLPRKFKIALEGCRHDHVGTAIQDLGLRAVLRDEEGGPRRGFSVFVAGGTSTLCTSGTPLVPFLPAGDVLALAEALVRLFHARGDRANKQRNRLKFLVRQLGFEPFRALLDDELAKVRAAGAPALPFDPERPPEERPPTRARAAAPARAADPGALAAFQRTNVRSQRQPGYLTVALSAPQGDVTADQLDRLADLAGDLADGTVRLASNGQLHLRWVRSEDLPVLFDALRSIDLGRAGAGSAGDVVSCPGSEACRLAVTHTRGVARAIEARIRSGPPEALETPLAVHVSGCPNGCSQHHLAAIGLQGSARKVGGRLVPQYFVLIGGGTADGGARFGKLAGRVPARRVPEAVERLAALYREARRPGEDAAAFFERSLDAAKAVLQPLEELRLEDAREADFVEPGTDGAFAPTTAEGECAA
jgi:sulfite reductase (NADPH) hemoprotein beta-component